MRQDAECASSGGGRGEMRQVALPVLEQSFFFETETWKPGLLTVSEDCARCSPGCVKSYGSNDKICGVIPVGSRKYSLRCCQELSLLLSEAGHGSSKAEALGGQQCEKQLLWKSIQESAPEKSLLASAGNSSFFVAAPWKSALLQRWFTPLLPGTLLLPRLLRKEGDSEWQVKPETICQCEEAAFWSEAVSGFAEDRSNMPVPPAPGEYCCRGQSLRDPCMMASFALRVPVWRKEGGPQMSLSHRFYCWDAKRTKIKQEVTPTWYSHRLDTWNTGRTEMNHERHMF